MDITAAPRHVVARPSVPLLRRLVRWVRRTLRGDRAVLPPDWWEQFETDLRAYASGSWRAAREEERRL